MTIKHGCNKIKKDHRDHSFSRTFGIIAPIKFPDSYSVDFGGMPDQNADGLPEGCTGYAQAELCSDEDLVRYLPRFTYEKSLMMDGLPPNSPLDIRTSLKSTIVYGVARENETDEQALTHRRGKYFAIENFASDWFDSIRTVMLNNPKRATSIGSPWFQEWESPWNGIVPAPVNYTFQGNSGHNWLIVGWKTIAGQLYLIGKSWQGEKYGDRGYAYFSRGIINSVLGISGTGAYTLAEARPQDLKNIKLTIIETIISFMRQWVNLLKKNLR